MLTDASLVTAKTGARPPVPGALTGSACVQQGRTRGTPREAAGRDHGAQVHLCELLPGNKTTETRSACPARCPVDERAGEAPGHLEYDVDGQMPALLEAGVYAARVPRASNPREKP